jgi:anti-sigma B factor antagonist
MTITQKDVGDVTVLELDGRFTLSESGGTVRARVTDLSGRGRNKVVLDLRNVSYVDSSGLGEIVQAFTYLQKAGGALLISRPSTAQLEQYAMTKLSAVFAVFPSIEDAVREFGDVQHVHVVCPACHVAPRIKLAMRHIYANVTCPACAAGFRVRAMADAASDPNKSEQRQLTASLSQLRLPTYDTEYVDVTPGDPSWVKMTRLDAFTVDMIEKAYTLLRDPLRVLFDVGFVSDSTSAGITRLTTRCERRQKGEAFAVYAHHNMDQRAVCKLLSPHFAIYRDWSTADNALKSGDGRVSSISVTFTRGG